MQPTYAINGQVYDVSPVRRTDLITLKVDGHPLDLRLKWLGANRGEIAVNGRIYAFCAAQDGSSLYLHFNGKSWHVEAGNEFDAAQVGGAAEGRISAPMPGVVVERRASEGDVVAAGDTLLLIESMKLQTEIKASVSGRLVTVGVKEGDSFEKGALLAEIEAESEAAQSIETAAAN